MKPFWQSKVIMANIIMGLAMVVGQFVPGVNEFVQAHFTAVGDAWAMINVVLRLVNSNITIS